MSREYTYSTKFNLVDPVLDMTEANKWIRAQNMTRWATESGVIPSEELSKTWSLKS